MCPDPKSDYWYCAAGPAIRGCRPKSEGPFPEEACDEQCTAVVPTGVPANIVVSEGTWAFSDFSGNFLEIIWCLFFLNLLSKFFGTKCGKHFQKKIPKKVGPLLIMHSPPPTSDVEETNPPNSTVTEVDARQRWQGSGCRGAVVWERHVAITC